MFAMLSGSLACLPWAQPLVVFWLFAVLKRVYSSSKSIAFHAVTGTDDFLETAEIRSLSSAELLHVCDQS